MVGSLLMRFCFFLLSFIFLAGTGFGQEKSFVSYDRGAKKGNRSFQVASRCATRPCIVTEDGAIRLSKKAGKKYRVELLLLHRGSLYPVSIFQESTTIEQQLSERIFNRRPNRKAIHLELMMERGLMDTIYIYGLLLQYAMEEGDLLTLKLTSLANPVEVEEYFFRFHDQGLQWDIDLAFVQPLNLFTPNPGGVIRAAYSTVALSLSVGGVMDPDRNYNLFGKIERAVRFNLFGGLLLREDILNLNGDNITQDYVDGFTGLGVTFFDFLAAGYGVNLVRSPHTTFPFVGIEIRHLLEFIHSLKKDTHTRWEKYLEEEKQRNL